MTSDTRAPDGSPVEVYARLGPGPAVDALADRLAPDARVLDLGCGAGRITNRLTDLGFAVVAVDQSPDMLAHVRCTRTVCARIADLDLGTGFDCVLLASFLVNEPEAAPRRAMLRAVRRHLGPDGTAFVQRLDPVRAFALRAGQTFERNGVAVGLEEVRITGDVVEFTDVFTVDGRVLRQPCRFRVLTDDVLAAELRDCGLRRTGDLGAGFDWVSVRAEPDR